MFALMLSVALHGHPLYSARLDSDTLATCKLTATTLVKQATKRGFRASAVCRQVYRS